MAIQASRWCASRCAVVSTVITGVVLVILGLCAQPIVRSVLRAQLQSTFTLDSSSAAPFDFWCAAFPRDLLYFPHLYSHRTQVWTGYLRLARVHVCERCAIVFLIVSLEFCPRSSQPPPTHATLQYFLFNVTNPDAVMQGAKPALKLVGPFTYVETGPKSSFSWDPSRVRLNYTYTFLYNLVGNICEDSVLGQAELPTCTVDDNTLITTGNAPLMGFLYQLMAAVRNPTEEDLIAIGLAMDIIIDLINKNQTDPRSACVRVSVCLCVSVCTCIGT
jgi:hypothetical protein